MDNFVTELHPKLDQQDQKLQHATDYQWEIKGGLHILICCV